MTGAARLTRAVGALALLIALVIGVPVALVILVGLPLPTALPAWSTVLASLRGGDIPDLILVKTLACIVWVAWAQLTVAVCWEVGVNVPRLSVGKPKRPAPPLVNRHLGSFAANIVGAVLVLSISTRTLPTAGLLPAPAPITATMPAAEVRPASPATPPARAGGFPKWVVQPGETLWGITERSTGNPDRLAELIDLNSDQVTRPRDVRAGMVLRLPPDATVPIDRQLPVVTPAAAAPLEHTVEPGENLWSISAGALRTPTDPTPSDREIAPYWETVIAANSPPISDPNLIYPGEEVLLPPTGAQIAATPATTPPAATPPTPATTPSTPAGAPPTEIAPTVAPAAPSGPADRRQQPPAESATAFPGWAAPAGLTGATLLATWATIEARRRRSYRLRRAKGGSVMPPPDPTIAPTTIAVVANTDTDTIDRLDTALRHLAATDGPFLPRPQLMLRHRDREIEVFLAQGIETAPEPWVARAGGQIWALAPDADLPEHPEVAPPCPALVQLGACDDGAELYADLEALGMLGVTGPPEAVRQISRALTATLVVSPAARQCRILTYGFDPYGLDDQAPTRLFVAPTLDAVIAEAQATARPIVAILAEDARIGSSFRLRAVIPEEGWAPAIVIVAGSPLSEDEAATLAALAGAGGQGAAVTIAGAETTWTLEADEPAGWWRLRPIGLRVQPVSLAADELRDIAGFLAEADAEPLAVNVRRPPLDMRTPIDAAGIGAAPQAETRTNGGFRERDWRVMVRLLGPADLVNRDGRSAAGERDQTVELLAWLVTHRDTATRAGATEALWAGRRVEPQTLYNVVSSARNLLHSLAGEPPDGGEWIPGRREQLLLHSAVVSDYDLLLDRLAYARRAGPADAAAVLADGVDVMRGVPLQGAEWQWADDQSVRSRLAVQAVEMATQLATLRLQAGDMRGASDASELGHAVIPFHDECTALAIQALAAAGNRPAALAKYDDYERQAMSRGEAIAPEVAKVRNDLLRA
jgi:DNA-binding SARP family transcriptional activator